MICINLFGKQILKKTADKMGHSFKKHHIIITYGPRKDETRLEGPTVLC